MGQIFQSNPKLFKNKSESTVYFYTLNVYATHPPYKVTPGGLTSYKASKIKILKLQFYMFKILKALSVHYLCTFKGVGEMVIRTEIFKV